MNFDIFIKEFKRNSKEIDKNYYMFIGEGMIILKPNRNLYIKTKEGTIKTFNLNDDRDRLEIAGWDRNYRTIEKVIDAYLKKYEEKHKKISEEEERVKKFLGSK